MFRTTKAFLTLCLIAPLSGGCGPSEADAKKHLEEQGFSITGLKKAEDGFEFTAKKGDDICTGTLSLKKGMGSESSNYTTSCQRDTSACKPGAVDVCVKIADELYNKEAKVFPIQAAELYRVACADKSAHACGRAAEYEAIGKKWEEVRKYSKMACELGGAEACVRLGGTELEGQGTPKDQAKALELFKTACEKGSVRGCRAAAGLMLDAEPSDLAGAMPLARKACEGKYDDSCFVLGIALFREKKDYKSALSHLEAACQDPKFEKRGPACNIAGAIVFDGLGMPKDIARGRDLFEKACESKSGDGCFNLANIHTLGQGVPRDAAKGKEFFKQACEHGHKVACTKA